MKLNTTYRQQEKMAHNKKSYVINIGARHLDQLEELIADELELGNTQVVTDVTYAQALSHNAYHSTSIPYSVLREEEERRKLVEWRLERERIETNRQRIEIERQQIEKRERQRIEREERQRRERYAEMEERKRVQAIQDIMDKDMAFADQCQIDEAIKISGEMEKQRQLEIAIAKREEEEKLKKRNVAYDDMKSHIVDVIKALHGSPKDFEKIATYFDNFERETGEMLSTFPIKRDFDTMNGRSALMLEIINIFHCDQIRKIIEFFEFHIAEIKTRYEHTIRHNLSKFYPEKHVLDPMNQFAHKFLDDKFKTINVKGDGNCLWNCISIALFGNYSKMESLRVLTANILLNNESLFRDYLSGQQKKYGYNHELTFEQLVKASVELQVWGDEMHILALSMALERPIYSYGSLNHTNSEHFQTYEDFAQFYQKTPLVNHFHYVANEKHSKNTPILLYYNGENHYNVVLPTDDEFDAPIPYTQILDPIFRLEKENAKFNDDEKAEFTHEPIVNECTGLKLGEKVGWIGELSEESSSTSKQGLDLRQETSLTNKLSNKQESSLNPSSRKEEILKLLGKRGYVIMKKTELDALNDHIASLQSQINDLIKGRETADRKAKEIKNFLVNEIQITKELSEKLEQLQAEKSKAEQMLNEKFLNSQEQLLTSDESL